RLCSLDHQRIWRRAVTAVLSRRRGGQFDIEAARTHHMHLVLNGFHRHFGAAVAAIGGEGRLGAIFLHRLGDGRHAGGQQKGSRTYETGSPSDSTAMSMPNHAAQASGDTVGRSTAME